MVIRYARSMDALAGNGQSWTRIAISRIEHLSDAVLAAGLEATQMSANALSGSLAFAERRGIIFSSGHIGGTVALRGPLSLDKVTIGIGLHLTPGTWHWMNEVHTGSIGVFHPGDEHDSRYTSGCLYATLSIDRDQLESEAAKQDLVLDRTMLGGTGVHPHDFDDRVRAELRREFARIHAGQASGGHSWARVCDTFLDAAICHLARQPSCANRSVSPSAHARIVRLARAYVLEHLAEPISLDAIATAAHASQRTLYRAFEEILNDTPQHFVRRLRLHRIRHDLASDAERACTIALVANQWGISEIGRMSAWYRDLFGERPSETRARAH